MFRDFYTYRLVIYKNPIKLNVPPTCREQQMLLNLHKKSWMEGLMLQNYNEHSSLNEDTVKEILNLATAYNKVA